MPLFLYLLLCYLLGSTGLYLLAPRLRQALENSATGNITVTNAVRSASRQMASANLLVEMLKPFVLVYIARYILGITAPFWLSMGIFLAIIGRIFPVFLGFRHGGKGTTTFIFGLIAIDDTLVPLIAFDLSIAAILLVSKSPHYRPIITIKYLLIPIMICLFQEKWDLILPVGLICASSIITSLIRPDDVGHLNPPQEA